MQGGDEADQDADAGSYEGWVDLADIQVIYVVASFRRLLGWFGRSLIAAR